MNNHLQSGSALRSAENTYIIRSVLGKGGFGITYKATYSIVVNGLPITASVAVKEFFMSQDCERDMTTGRVSVSNAARTRTEPALKDFIGEAKRLNSISGDHPNIIRVSEVFEANDTAYYVMEYLEGTSLDARVKSQGALSEAETLNILCPIVNAVAYLHRHRITHLDIKPANIMLTVDADGNPRPVLIDFGLSKHYDDEGNATSTINTMGHSEGYSPIEQYTGIRNFSPASDVYSLGATMFFCLTGHRPAVASELDVTAVDAELDSKGVSPNLRRAIVASLSLRITDRPADAGKLLAMLGDVVDSMPNPIVGPSVEADVALRHPRIQPHAPSDSSEDPSAGSEPIPISLEDDNKKRSVRTWILAGIAGFLITLIALGVYFLFFFDPRSSSGESTLEGDNAPVEQASFRPDCSYVFTSTGHSLSSRKDSYTYDNLIVPFTLPDSTTEYMWCLKTDDGYWAAITDGFVSLWGEDQSAYAIYFRANSDIDWFVNYGGVGFSLGAERDNDNVLTLTTDNDMNELNPWIANNIFGDNNTFQAGISDITRTDALADTKWYIDDGEKETVLEFDMTGVTLKRIYNNGYQSERQSLYMAYYQEGVLKFGFLSGDNPENDVITGYFDGEKLVFRDSHLGCGDVAMRQYKFARRYDGMPATVPVDSLTYY